MHRDEEKQRLSDQVNRWISTIRSSKSVPVATSPLLESPDWWKPEFVDPEVEAAISGFRKSKQILEQLGDDNERGPSGNSFELPLGVVLDALPERYVQEGVSAADRAMLIRVFVEDLFAQLARGDVRVTVARLVFGVPVGFIASVALRDTETRVALPLKAVVEAVGTVPLAERTAKPGKRPDISHLPELFTPAPSAPAASLQEQPVPTVDLAIATMPQGGEATGAAAPAPPVSVPHPEPAVRVPEAPAPLPPTSIEPVEAAAPIPEPAAPPPAALSEPLPAPAAVFVNTEAIERMNANGVDLNRASLADLLTLPGVTAVVARAILGHREAHGPFATVFALADVPRVGRKTFRKITGMPFSRTQRHRATVLVRWLGLAAEDAGNLPALVRAVAARPGLAGCVMSDADGLLLAESGASEQAPTLSAIVPRLMSQMHENIRELGGDGVAAVSITYGSRLITIVRGGDVYLTVVHAANRLTTGLHQFLRRVALELAWWFSRRGYVTAEAEVSGEGGRA